MYTMMERYMIHLKNTTYTRVDASDILGRARVLAGSSMTIRDVRVAPSHIEIDTTIPDGALATLLDSLRTLGGTINSRLITNSSVPKREAMLEGIECFNGERFWECHEAFEGVWKECHGDEKDILQGIILTAAGLVHYQKNSDIICISIFRRALEKLSGFTGTYDSIDIDALQRQLKDAIRSGRITTFMLA